MKFKLEKKELSYAFIGVIVILVWFLYLKNLIAPYLTNVFPFIAMLCYNLGMFVGLLLISSILNSTKTRVKASIIGFMILLGEDILMAPYLIDKTGVTNSSAIEMWNVASDVGFGSLYQLFLTGFPVWLFTYIITPILLIFIIPIIVANPKTIRKVFS